MRKMDHGGLKKLSMARAMRVTHPAVPAAPGGALPQDEDRPPEPGRQPWAQEPRQWLRGQWAGPGVWLQKAATAGHANATREVCAGAEERE